MKIKNKTKDLSFLLDEPRLEMFEAAIKYINYEMIEGDIVEFGVWAGKTLALLSYLSGQNRKVENRKIIGFDSFEGLPHMSEIHPRWFDGICKKSNESKHPVAKHGEEVSPELTFRLFDYYGLEKPVIRKGYFDKSIAKALEDQTIRQTALIHLDCDLYESTLDVLNLLHPTISSGALLLFDDFFHYQADPRKGQSKALNEFMSNYSDTFILVPYKDYHTFCKAFFLIRK